MWVTPAAAPGERPGSRRVVAIALALGIGVNTATFAVLDELYLRPPAGVLPAWRAAHVDPISALRAD